MAEAHTIITYGGGEILDIVFNAIASMFNDNELNNAMNIAATLLGFWIIITAIARNSGIIPFKWFLWFLLITQVMFLPKTTVMIVDPLTKFQRPVKNVPYLLGTFASTVSIVGDVLTKKMETYFSLPEDMRYRGNGTLFASKLFSQMHQYKVNDAVLKGNLHRFIQNCVVYDAMVGQKYTLKELQESTDILSLVSNTSTIIGFPYQEKESYAEVTQADGSKKSQKTGGSRIVSCQVGIELIKKQLNNEVGVVASRLGSKFNLRKFKPGEKPTIEPINPEQQSPTNDNRQINNAVKNVFLSKLSNSYQFMTQISKTGEDLLKQEMVINAIQDASKNKVEELGSPHTYAVTKALMQQKTTYQVLGDIAAQTLPITKIVFEVLAYASFIFVAMLVLMPNGLQILTNYLGLLMWLQLWAPLFAVVNLIATLFGRYFTQGHIGERGLSMLTSVGLSNLHSNLEATAFMVSSLVPLASYYIIKGGTGSFMQIASALNGGYQAASASAASEVSSGNLSMGNISYGTSSLNNFSGFKYDSNFSHQSGRMDSMNDDGTLSFMTPSGTSGFRGGAGMTTSTWEHQLNMQKSLSGMTQTAISDEKSKLAGLNHEYSTAQSHAFRDATDFLARMNQSGSSSGSWSVSGGSEQVAAANDTKNFMHELQNRYGYSATQAAEVAGGVSVGVPGAFHAGANWRSSSDYQDALNKGKQLAESMGVTQSISKSLRHADQFSFNENEQYEQGLAKSLSGSFDRASATRDAISISEQKVHRLSTMQSHIDSTGVNLTKEGNQELLEHIANQPARATAGGKAGVIGMQSAQKIVRAQGEEYNMYLNSFMGSKFQEVYSTLSDMPGNSVTGQQTGGVNNVGYIQPDQGQNTHGTNIQSHNTSSRGNENTTHYIPNNENVNSTGTERVQLSGAARGIENNNQTMQNSINDNDQPRVNNAYNQLVANHEQNYLQGQQAESSRDIAFKNNYQSNPVSSSDKQSAYEVSSNMTTGNDQISNENFGNIPNEIKPSLVNQGSSGNGEVGKFNDNKPVEQNALKGFYETIKVEKGAQSIPVNNSNGVVENKFNLNEPKSESANQGGNPDNKPAEQNVLKSFHEKIKLDKGYQSTAGISTDNRAVVNEPPESIPDKQKSELANQALSWQGKESRLISNQDKVTYSDVKDKAKEAYNNTHPSVPTSLDGIDLKKGSYESLRSQVMANTNLEGGSNKVAETITESAPKFTADFKNNLSNNLNELSKHYASYPESNITNEVNKTHSKVPEEIDKVRLNTNKEELKLNKEYKETKDTLHTVKAAKNILKEEKE